jgi:hypothetical protein
MPQHCIDTCHLYRPGFEHGFHGWETSVVVMEISAAMTFSGKHFKVSQVGILNGAE